MKRLLFHTVPNFMLPVCWSVCLLVRIQTPQTGPAFWHTPGPSCGPPGRVVQSAMPCMVGVKPKLLPEAIDQAGLVTYVYTGAYKHKKSLFWSGDKIEQLNNM